MLLLGFSERISKGKKEKERKSLWGDLFKATDKVVTATLMVPPDARVMIKGASTREPRGCYYD